MVQSLEVDKIQVLGSESSWKKLTQIRLGFLARFVIALCALLLTLLTLVGFALALILKSANLMTCSWIKLLHRLSLMAMRRIRWSAIVALSGWIGVFNPSLALTLVMSYCMMRSYDFPEHWMQWLMKFDKRRVFR